MKIMLNGGVGSGKDTVADRLVDEHNFIKLSFADGIYDIAYNIFDMKQKDRRLLQDIGEKLRSIDEDVWVNHVCKRVDELGTDCNIVISDCRQSNEYNVLKAEGFYPVQIQSDKNKRLKRVKDRDGIVHEDRLSSKCETDADDKLYHVISNNGNLKQLYSTVDELCSYIAKSNSKISTIKHMIMKCKGSCDYIAESYIVSMMTYHNATPLEADIVISDLVNNGVLKKTRMDSEDLIGSFGIYKYEFI